MLVASLCDYICRSLPGPGRRCKWPTAGSGVMEGLPGCPGSRSGMHVLPYCCFLQAPSCLLTAVRQRRNSPTHEPRACIIRRCWRSSCHYHESVPWFPVEAELLKIYMLRGIMPPPVAQEMHVGCLKQQASAGDPDSCMLRESRRRCCACFNSTDGLYTLESGRTSSVLYQASESSLSVRGRG